jgi:hypothetical protein
MSPLLKLRLPSPAKRPFPKLNLLVERFGLVEGGEPRAASLGRIFALKLLRTGFWRGGGPAPI